MAFHWCESQTRLVFDVSIPNEPPLTSFQRNFSWYGQMDVGVGSFVVSSALVSKTASSSGIVGFV